MSLRKLPELGCPEGRKGSVHLSEKAAQLYRPVAAPQFAAGDEATISILDVIGPDWWTGGGVTAARIQDDLRRIGNRPVTVLVNSPGGDFFEGVTIYNLLCAHPAKVTVQIIGIAASAASVVAMAGDDIQIAQLGFMMIHNTQWCACGDRHVMYETGDIMKVFDDAVAEMYAERAGLDVGAVKAMLDAETWLASAAAVEQGFADRTATFEVSPSEVSNSKSALYRIEAALASGKQVPRAERRKLMKEIVEGMPGAASDVVMPSADDDTIDRLRLAAARLSLTRA